MAVAERALAVLVALAVIAGVVRGQDLIVRESGSQYVFFDDRDPDLAVIVGLGGVEIVRGEQRILAESMVLLVDGSAAGPEADDTGGQVIAEKRLLEAFFTGDVTMQQADEIMSDATAVHIDNRSGLVTLMDGSWRSALQEQPILMRFEIMRSFVDGSYEIEHAQFTTCDYAHAHWALETPWAIVEPTPDGRVLKTSRSVGQVGDTPLVPLPGFHLNIDRDRPPLRRVAAGNSTRFGFEVQTEWGGDATDAANEVGRWFDAKVVDADWNLKLDAYTKRGFFFEPSIEYETRDSFGRIMASYINDTKTRDHLGNLIEDPTRGRFDVEHRTRIDDKQVVDIEISYESDRDYLREYYETQFRNEKPQETYLNYRHVDDNVAWQALGRVRLNDFQDQVEYLPRVERRQVAESYDLGGLGEGFSNGRDFADVARLQLEEPAPGEPNAPAGSLVTRNVRAGTRRDITIPFDIGEDRVTVAAGASLTGFERTAGVDPATGGTVIDSSGTVRYALATSVGWSRTYSGIDSNVRNSTWNFDGVRQILEPSASFDSVLEINDRPDDLLQIDDTETLDKLQVFNLGLRHRVQTHQRDEVATVFDTQLTMPIFTNEERDNDGDTLGQLTADSVWNPGADIWGLRQATVNVRTTVDPNNAWGYTRSFASYSTRIADKGRITLANDKVRRTSNFASFGLEWELTPKWTGALFVQEDLREQEGARRGILLRQKAHRWLIDIEISQRRANSTIDGSSDLEEAISINFRPALLVRSDETLLSRIADVRQR